MRQGSLTADVQLENEFSAGRSNTLATDHKPTIAGRAKALLEFGLNYWQVAVAGVPALLGGAWAYLTHHDYVETVLLGLWTFVGCMLAIGSVLWLRDRKTANRVRIEHDLAYGLGYHSMTLGVDLSDQERSVQFGISFQNVTSHGLEMLVTRFDVVIGTRTLPSYTFIRRPVIVPRHLMRSYRNKSFSFDAIRGYLGAKTNGCAEIWMKYGPIGGPMTRLLHLKLDLILTLKDSGEASFSETITLETESEVAVA